MSILKKTTLNSLKWSSLEKIGQFSMQIIISIILARLLMPEQYATVGILNIFVLIATVLVDAGFSQCLIRKQNCSNDDYNAVFWFNLLMSIVIYAVLYFCMPFIANIFEDHMLIATGRVMMLLIPIQALNVVQVTIVNKDLGFKKIAKYTITATVLSGIVGIVLAFCNYGVWALVWQTLTFTSLNVVAFWFSSKWKPTFGFNFKPIKKFLNFSLNLSAASLLNAIFNNISPAIIAKLYEKTQFGFYSQAQKFATLPTNLVESILNRMTYPILSKLQDDRVCYSNVYRKMLMTIFAVIVPLMTVLILCSNEGIVLILGEKWEPSVTFFKILCLASITLPIHPLAMSNLKVFGKAQLIFKLEIVKKILIIASIIIGLYWGVMGLVWGQTIYFWIVLMLNLYYAGKDITYSIVAQLKDITPIFILSGTAYCIASLIGYLNLNIAETLFLKGFVFLTIFLGGVFGIKIEQFSLVKSLIKR